MEYILSLKFILGTVNQVLEQIEVRECSATYSQRGLQAMLGVSS